MRSRKRKAQKITIRNLTRRRIPGARTIKKIIRKILELEKCRESDVSVTYVNDARIRKLNRAYRGTDAATDVLAFSMREGRAVKGSQNYLGDIIISIDAAERQAGRFRSTRERELALYLIHGVLHLVGYDDETKRRSQKMKKREEYLLKRIS